MALAPVTDTMRPMDGPAASRRGRGCGSMEPVICGSMRSRLGRAPCSPASRGALRRCTSDTSERDGSTTVTSVPSDLALRISRRPPCSCTSALAIGRPSPAPSRQRERPASTWPNGVSATAISSLGHAEAGVAHAHRGAAAGAGARLDGHRAARRRELDGVGDQVGEHLAQLGRVALDRRAASAIEPALERARRPRRHVGLKEASAACRISSSSTSRASSVYLPLCILEMSRMSLMTASRCVAASRMRSAYSTISRVRQAPLAGARRAAWQSRSPC